MASSTIRKREIRTALRERADAWQREFFRHELLTARYVRGVQLEAEADFQRRVVRPLLFELPAKLAAVRARGDDYTRDMFPAMASMLDDISRTIAKGADAAGKLTAKRMAEIAEREVEWTASALKRAAPEVKAEVGRELGKDAAGEAAQGTKDRIWLGDTTERVFAKDLGEKTGEAVRRTITTAQKHGLSVDGTVKLLRGSPGKTGILAEKPVYTIRGLVRSAATHASSAGRMASYRALGVTHWRFIATLDQRTTIQCASEDGNTYPLDEGPIPPLHVNCFPGDTLVTSVCSIAGVSKRWFDGEVCTVRTASGRVLTGTPNHPVLTNRGWIGIGSLAVGDHVVCDGGSQWRGTGDGDDKDVPTSIHDVAEAFFASGDVASCPVPVSAPHFHGDGSDGQVAVVGADRRLRPVLHAALSEHRREVDLVVAHDSGPAIGTFDEFFRRSLAATHGGMSGGGERLPFGWAGSGHPRELLLASAAWLAAVGDQGCIDLADGDAGSPRNAGRPDAAVEHLDHGDRVECGNRRDEAALAHVRAASGKRPVDDVAADAALAREIIGGSAGAVFTDEVAEVGKRRFAGHVFNLETEGGFYSANGIVVHNCRSSVAPVIEGMEPFGTRASIKGPVSAKTNFEEWLAQLPQDEQEMVLGKTKARAWRAGKLTLKQMLGADLQPLTLAELEGLDLL